MEVERLADAKRIPFAAQIKAHDLPQRMHARIGAACRLDRDRLAAHLLDGLFDNLLHAERIGLPLPSGERRSIILELEAVAGH